MTTRDAMKTEILDDLDRSSSADGTRVLAAISSAIKFYQPKRFFFNESRSTTFTTTAADWDYTFGSGGDITQEFYRIDLAVLEEASADYVLTRRDYRDIERLNDGSATSNRPYNYAYVDQQLVLYPIPDDTYTIRLTGHIKYAEPAADATAGNEWFTEAYELIRSRAKAYLYAHVYPNPENLQLAAVMKMAEKEALSSLMSATHDKVSLGCIEPTDF